MKSLRVIKTHLPLEFLPSDLLGKAKGVLAGFQAFETCTFYKEKDHSQSSMSAATQRTFVSPTFTTPRRYKSCSNMRATLSST